MSTEYCKAETNISKILAALSGKGPRSTKELIIDTGLTLNQVKCALHYLHQNKEIKSDGSNWALSASKLERFLIARAWNKSVFEGVMA